MIANKLYSKYVGRIAKHRAEDAGMKISEYYMNKIDDNILETMKVPMQFFTNSGPGYQLLSLKAMIDRYKNMGVKQLIIFDTSCSSFHPKGKLFLTEKEAKTIKKNLRDTIVYGGNQYKMRMMKSRTGTRKRNRTGTGTGTGTRTRKMRN